MILTSRTGRAGATGSQVPPAAQPGNTSGELREIVKRGVSPGRSRSSSSAAQRGSRCGLVVGSVPVALDGRRERLGGGPLAVGAAQRGQGQVQERGVAHDRLEVHLVALDRVGLALHRVDLEDLAAGRRWPSPPISSRHRRHSAVHGTCTVPLHGDRPVDRLEDGVDHELGVVGDLRTGDAEPGQGGGDVDVALRAGSAPQLHHPDPQDRTGHRATRGPGRRPPGRREARRSRSPGGISPAASDALQLLATRADQLHRALEHDLEAGELLVAEVLHLVLQRGRPRRWRRR